MQLKLYLLCIAIPVLEAAKILCFFPASSYSHQIIYQPIWKELSLRGHNVTVITPNPLKDPSLVNLTEIDLHDTFYPIWQKHNISKLGFQEEVNLWDFSVYERLFLEQLEAMMEIPKARDIYVKGTKGQFDLLIVEPTMAAPLLKDIYECPLIVLLSLPLPNCIHALIGNPNHPILHPEFILPFSRRLRFGERLQSVLVYLLGQYICDMPSLDDYVRRFVPKVRTSVEASMEASLAMANTNPILSTPRANGPWMVEFSGMHIRPPKELPKEIAEFMNKATEGVIYISFGSNIRSSDMPIHKLKSILDTIAELPFKFLWKFEADNLPSQPPNLLVQKWLPQQDVLRHPNLKLFVMQGGLQSLEEAMYTATPVVVVPFFGDQQANAQKVVDAGMGVTLRYSTLTKDGLKASILEALSHKYQRRLLELQKIITDQREEPLDKVIWWIEYVIRHKGAKHLRSPALDIPAYQLYLVDVIAFVAFVTLVLVILLVKLVRLVCRLGKKIKVKKH